MIRTDNVKRAARISALAVLASTCLASAGPGLVELTLDRQAVAALLSASIPTERAMAIPGGGKMTLVLSGADKVTFVSGGLESTLGVKVKEFGLSGQVAVRYEPQVDRETGKVQFVPVRSKPTGALSMLPDLSGFLSPLDLPRGFNWILTPDGRSHHQLDIDVHGVEVGEKILTIKLSLGTRPIPASAVPPQARSKE